jgi:hypothetical protein
MRYLVSLLLVLIYPLAAFANFTGPVVSVLDGDTIEAQHNTHPEHIRLSFNNSLPYIDTYAYLWINNGNHTVTGILFEIVS